jgi:hypothetical protein
VFASELPIAGAMGLKENFKIEVASDSFYEFDSKGNLVDQVVPTDEEIKSAATQCVLMASENLGQDKMWNIENNKLIRQYIS